MCVVNGNEIRCSPKSIKMPKMIHHNEYIYMHSLNKSEWLTRTHAPLVVVVLVSLDIFSTPLSRFSLHEVTFHYVQAGLHVLLESIIIER